MFRGDVNVTSYDETGALDTVIEMGIYKVKPKQGVWGTLVVFNAFDGAGGVVQKLYNATGAKIELKTQIQITYGLIGNLFNEKFQLVHAWKNWCLNIH